MDNIGFSEDGEPGGLNGVPLQEITNRKIPEEHNKDIEEGDRSSVRQRKKENKLEKESGEGRKEEGEEEDYSLLSYFPRYKEFKTKLSKLIQKHNLWQWFKAAFFLLLAVLYCVYLISVVSIVSAVEKEDYWCNGDGFVLVMTAFVAIMMLYFLVIKKYYGKFLYTNYMKPTIAKIDSIFENKFVKIAVYAILSVSLLIFLVIDTSDDRNRLVSLFGVFCLILLGFLFSYAPRKIVWRHVVWGLGLQFAMGLMILRWSVGKAVFQCAGDKTLVFLKFTDVGSKFVFGALVDELNIFAFQVLPVVLFFSFCIQILYFYGIMQWIVMKMGWLLQVTVGTTACESVNAAAGIFLGQSEAPLLIKPYLSLMTKSEIHAVMTGGFATIAGSVMAAYISFGVSPSHLLSASVMSAPAALAYAKLFYPETEVSKTNAKDIKIEKSTEANALHAACEGVVQAIPLVANIAANVVVFISFIAFVNSLFDWSCQLVNVEQGTCTLENVFGYLFMPLAWVMGVPWADCQNVGYLIGLKTIVNEFVAYSQLGIMSKEGTISARAEIIATYALCGFSNIGAIGVQLGSLGSMAPDRRADIAKVAVRAMIAGSAACFLTGCIAGTLLDAESLYQSGNATQTR